MKKWDEEESIGDVINAARDSLRMRRARRIARGELDRGRQVVRKEKSKQLPWWERLMTKVTVTDEEAWQAIGYDNEESWLAEFKKSDNYNR